MVVTVTMSVPAIEVGVRMLAAAAAMIMMGALVVVAMRRLGPRVAPEEENESQPGDGQSREGADPGVELLGHDVARGIERDAPQQVHTGRVGSGHDEAQEQGVP